MEEIPRSICQFVLKLKRQDLSPLTLINYRADLLHFSSWLKTTTGDDFSPTTVTPTDIREYRAFLITVERRAPTTVNRHLASLRKFFSWAQGAKLAQDNPALQVKGVGVERSSPKSLDKR